MSIHYKESRRLRTKLFAVSILCLFSVSIAGCILAVPVAVMYIKNKDMVRLTMELDGNASDIYAASVKTQMRKSPETEVIKDDREKLLFEGKKVEAGGVELWGRWQARQLSEGRTEVDFQLKAEGMEEEALKERAISNVQAFCAEIGKRCRIEK